MFKKTKEIIHRLVDAKKSNIDVSRFNDDVATITSWEALNTTASNFNTRVLTVSDDGSSIKFKTTVGAKIFFSLFIATGVGFLSFVGPRQQGRWIPQSFVEEGLAQLACIFFIAFGVFFLYYISAPIEIRKIDSMLVKGRGRRKRSISFSEIHALQLIPSYVTNSDGPDYYNYQINIVFKDGERMNVVTYHSPEKASQDAKIISRYINRPLWKAI